MLLAITALAVMNSLFYTVFKDRFSGSASDQLNYPGHRTSNRWQLFHSDLQYFDENVHFQALAKTGVRQVVSAV